MGNVKIDAAKVAEAKKSAAIVEKSLESTHKKMQISYFLCRRRILEW